MQARRAPSFGRMGCSLSNQLACSVPGKIIRILAAAGLAVIARKYVGVLLPFVWENWWTNNEESLDQQDSYFSEEDEEYEQVLITFHQAKEALRNARVARSFYLVVVPSSMFVRTRKGKGKGKVKRKNKGRGRGKSSGKSRGKGRGPGKNSQPGRAGKGTKNSAKARADSAKGRPSSSQHASASVDADSSGAPSKK